jgi:hypothetical protein
MSEYDPNDLTMPRLDRTVVAMGRTSEQRNDWAYWLSRPPLERWAAMETMRVLNFGDAATAPRIQRIFTSSKRPKG